MTLDVVRGVAVCGILFANVGAIMGVYVPWENHEPPISFSFLHLFFQERFFPIFSLLFGIGFGMLWNTTTKRSSRPRLVLARRLIFLLLLGAVHRLMQGGEALLPYAVCGLVFLIPMTFLPATYLTRVSLTFGVLATAVGGYFGGMVLIPGLFWLGFSLARCGIPIKFEESVKPSVLLLIGGLAVAIPGVTFQLLDLKSAGFSPSSSYAGLGQAAVYISLIGLGMHTEKLRKFLAWFFAPLGRTALTSYVSATVVGVLIALPLFAPFGSLLGREPVLISDAGMFAIWGGCVVFLVIQSLAARAWLLSFGQGPLEKLWRSVTWWGKK